MLLSIPNPLGNESDFFGQSIAAVGDDILVGASRVFEAGEHFSGRAYLFDGQTGELIRPILNPMPEDRAGFGEVVTALDDKAVIAAPGNTRRVYVFDPAVNDPLTTITPYTSPNITGAFAQAMTTRGSDVMIADSAERRSGVCCFGAAYLFNALTGEHLLTIPTSDQKRQQPRFRQGRGDAERRLCHRRPAGRFTIQRGQ